MFPEIDYNFEEELEEEVELQSTTIGRTPLFDFTENKYVVKDGKIVECTQEEAVQQWLAFLIKTAIGKYEVYNDTDFGTGVENYIGRKDTAWVRSVMKSEIEEKALQNRAIKSIEDFRFERNNGRTTIYLTAVMQDEEEVEVETDVEG